MGTEGRGMYHGQLLPFIIIHQKVWGCMEKKFKWLEKKKHSNGIELMVLGLYINV